MLENLPEGCITYDSLSAQFPGVQANEGSQYYYKYIIANMPPPQDGDGNGNGGSGHGSGLSCDGGKNQGSHKGWEEISGLSEAEKEVLEEATGGILKQTAEQVEKSRGTIPGCFHQKIEELFKVKAQVFNWKAYFRRLLGTAEEWDRKSTRKRESKRFPGAVGSRHKHRQKILVAVDTSGSVNDKELEDFFSEITYIWKAGASIDIIEYDTQINKVWQFKGKMPTEITGRGGTWWSKSAYEWYKPRMKDYSAFVTFTDGYDDFVVDRGLRNGIFVITSAGRQDAKYPGKVVKIPAEK